MVIGPPQTVSDELAEWFEAGAVDGYKLSPATCPTDSKVPDCLEPSTPGRPSAITAGSGTRVNSKPTKGPWPRSDEPVARFHPLIDRNKRTGWTLMVLLLWISGYRHDFNTDEGFALVVGVAARDLDLQVSAVLIRQHLIRR